MTPMHVMILVASFVVSARTTPTPPTSIRQQKLVFDALLKNIGDLKNQLSEIKKENLALKEGQTKLMSGNSELKKQLNNITAQNVELKSDFAGLKSELLCELKSMENRLKGYQQWTLEVTTGGRRDAYTTTAMVSVVVVMERGTASLPVIIPPSLLFTVNSSGSFTFLTEDFGKLVSFKLAMDSTDGWYGTATLWDGRGRGITCGSMQWLDKNDAKTPTRQCTQWIPNKCH